MKPVLLSKVANNILVGYGEKQYLFTEQELMETNLPLATYLQQKIQSGEASEVAPPAAPSDR